MNNWQKVGIINVDAGLCWIGDPCYCVTPDCTNHPAKTWKDFCAKLFGGNGSADAHQWADQSGRAGLGVTVSTGYGDGTYPVYVRKMPDGRIAEVKVVFIDDNDNDNDNDNGE